MDVKRYDFEASQHNESASMQEYTDGEYVRYDDAKTLIAERDAEIERLKKYIDSITGVGGIKE